MHPVIPIVYEHNDFVVVNKPCDVPMHDPEIGICQLLMKQLSLPQLFLVHRLDSATSGCLLLAKNKRAASVLSAQFANREIEKYYLAISDAKPKKKQGKLAGDMKKTRGGSYKLGQSENAQATAVTFFFSESIDGIGRLFYLKPITGKTHQLRVALQSIGSTILGDKRYKGSIADRLYLHSYQLHFNYANSEFSLACLPQSGDYFTDKILNNLKSVKDFAWPKYKTPSNVAVTTSKK